MNWSISSVISYLLKDSDSLLSKISSGRECSVHTFAESNLK